MKIFLIILAVIIILIVGLYAYYGGFTQVKFITNMQGGEIMVYKKHTGDYSQTGKITNEIYYTLLNNFKIETYKGIGIYYDNPQHVDKSQLRSDVGCILEEKDYDRQTELQNTFLITKLPQTEYLYAEMPYRGTISIFVGMMKVYPALNKYIKENNINNDAPITEIYDVPNKKIIYRREVRNKQL